MPPRTRHQFGPIDTPRAVSAFYDHWRPDAGIFVESEIWPNMLIEGQRRDIPLALLNARMSEKSVRGWQKWPATAQRVLSCFDILIAQNPQNAKNLADMGAQRDRIQTGTNLKSMSAPLPVDETTLNELKSWLGSRPLWVASSTHPGEEEPVLEAHAALLATHPDLCLLLVPRHPERGDDVMSLIEGKRSYRCTEIRGRAAGRPTDLSGRHAGRNRHMVCRLANRVCCGIASADRWS